MAETAEQYIKRLLGNLGGTPALWVQQATPQKLAQLIKRCDRKKLTKRPAPDKWSVGEILAHLADSELAVSWRLRMTLTSNGTALQAYDQDVWATTFHYGKRDPKVSLETFRVLRTSNLALLKSVPKALLENYGLQAERGKESVSHLANMEAGHDLNHLKQVEQVLKPTPAKKRTK